MIGVLGPETVWCAVVCPRTTIKSVPRNANRRTCQDGGVSPDEGEVAEALRRAGARFAFVHGSRATGELARPDSDLDIGAWWGRDAPNSWTVVLPNGTDLVVLDHAPLWLAGRIAQHGRLLFDDDPPVRVRWQADTRLQYLDDLPAVDARYQMFVDRIEARRLARG
jgi:uncharacterized protein